MAFDTYMQIGDGTDVVGEATASGIPTGAFEIFSFSWGASNPTTVGTTGGRTVGRQGLGLQLQRHEEVGEVVPEAVRCLLHGPALQTAQVVCRKAAGTAGKQSTFIQYDFTDVMVESVQWSGSSGGDDTPTESVSFAFAKVKITYNSQDSATGATDEGRRRPVGT